MCSALLASQVPDSRRAIEKGDLCRRKTMKEVDLNRNYPFKWQVGT